MYQSHSFTNMVLNIQNSQYKMISSSVSSNYGPTIRIQKEAEKKGCSQVLWLLENDRQVYYIYTYINSWQYI